MTTLQKFKLLATQCGNPTRSPSTSPVIHLRRRKTLRMLLSRTGRPSREEFINQKGVESKKECSSGVRRKLKDLLVSSPPPSQRLVDGGGGGSISDGGMIFRRVYRPLTGTLRQRLLRRAWRPVLVTIPE